MRSVCEAKTISLNETKKLLNELQRQQTRNTQGNVRLALNFVDRFRTARYRDNQFIYWFRIISKDLFVCVPFKICKMFSNEEKNIFILYQDL